MLSIKALITALLVGATIATPITSSAAKAVVDSRSIEKRVGGGGESWAVVGRLRRGATDDVVNVMRRDGASVLEGHCTQEEGVCLAATPRRRFRRTLVVVAPPILCMPWPLSCMLKEDRSMFIKSTSLQCVYSLVRIVSSCS